MNNNPFLNYILWGVKIVIIVGGVYFCLASMMQGDPKSYEPSNMPGVVEEKAKTNAAGEVKAAEFERVNEINDAKHEAEFEKQTKKAHYLALMGTQFALWVCILTAILALVFGIYSLVINFNKAKPFLIGLGIFAAIMVISILLASDDPLPNWKYVAEKTPGGMTEEVAGANAKWAGIGLIAVAILAVGAVVSVIVSIVNKLIK